MSTTRLPGQIEASPADVYRTLLEADAVSKRTAQYGKTGEILLFDAQEGGGFRGSLTYDKPTGPKESAGHRAGEQTGEGVTHVPLGVVSKLLLAS